MRIVSCNSVPWDSLKNETIVSVSWSDDDYTEYNGRRPQPYSRQFLYTASSRIFMFRTCGMGEVDIVEIVKKG